MMNIVYLVCFVLGLTLSLLSVFGGLGRLHFGHVPVGGHVNLPAHAGSAGHAGHAGHAGKGQAGSHLSAVNGFTLPAFLGWFGGAGYLLANYSPLIMPLVLLFAVLSGFVGASIIYVLLFKLLLPRERVLTAEDTRIEGVVGRVSDEIRDGEHVGEILYTQMDARRSVAARSEDGHAIARGTEVVVLRYTRGIAYVSPLAPLLEQASEPESSQPAYQ